VEGDWLVKDPAFLRGYQREDGTEPFGYKDGLRNIRSDERARFVFVDRDRLELAEPAWAEGGSYMAYLKIHQRLDQFAALADDTARNAVIGRSKEGTRLDLIGQDVAPREEPGDVPSALPPTAHVRTAGPRGQHDDTQIFRRGLPFLETTPEGEFRVGLNFLLLPGLARAVRRRLQRLADEPRLPATGGGR
jgi:deferrochelatase/peroxidase EfeB